MGNVKDDPFFFSFNFFKGAPPRTSLTLTVTDALGRPLSGAEVRPALHDTRFRLEAANTAWRNGLARLAVDLPPLRADALGRIKIEFTESPTLSLSLLVSHPEYGTAYCPTVATGHPGAAPAGAGSGMTLMTQLVRRGSPEERTAFHGQLVDERDRPLAGLRVVAMLPPAAAPGLTRNPVLSGSDGRFTLYPFNFSPSEKTPELPANTALIVQVKSADTSRLPLLAATLDNRTSHVLRIPGNLARPHALFFVEAGGKKINVGLAGINIFRNEELPASEKRRPQSEWYSPGDPAKGGEYLLPPGPYMVYHMATNTVFPFVVTLATPREIEIKLPVNPRAGGAAPTAGRQLPVPPRVILSYEGRVIDALNSRPMAGIAVGVISDREHNAKDFSQTVHTDAAGRYTVACKPWETVSAIRIQDERYLDCGFESLRYQPGVTSGTQFRLPPLMLYPAAKLSLKARLETGAVKKDQAPVITVRYDFADPKDGIWNNVFGRQNALGGKQYFISGSLPPTSTTTWKIPANVRVRMTLAPAIVPRLAPLSAAVQPARWQPASVERVVELKPGETLDLGTLAFAEDTRTSGTGSAAGNPAPERNPPLLPAGRPSLPAAVVLPLLGAVAVIVIGLRRSAVRSRAHGAKKDL